MNEAETANIIEAQAAEYIGERCDDCGGLKPTETTPPWVYDEQRICDCNEE